MSGCLVLLLVTFCPLAAVAQAPEALDATPSADAAAGTVHADAGADVAPAPVASPVPPAVQDDPGAGADPGPAASGPIASQDFQDISELDLEALLENVVVSATKSSISEDRAPAITTVINREEIQRWGYRSVAEALRHVAGIYVLDDHILPNVAIRGVSGGLRSESGLIKVMIDGRPVAFRSTSGNWLGAELVPLSLVQRIEVIRGPASALYGADAFLGVINVVTRRASDLQGGEVTLEGNREGAFGWGEDLAVGTAKGPWQITAGLRLSTEDRSGVKLPSSSPGPRVPGYAPSDGAARGLTLKSNVALARVAYQLGDRGTITLTGYLSGLERGAEFADWAQLTHNLDASGRLNGTNLSLRQGTLDLDAAFKVRSDLNVRFSCMYFAGGPTSSDRIEVGSDLYYVRREFGYRGLDSQIEATWNPSSTVSVLWGAGYILDHEKLPVVLDVLKTSVGDLRAGDVRAESTAQGSVNLSNAGTNAQVVWTPRERISVLAGARYDYHSVYGGKPSGRLGFVLGLLPDLHLKLLYGGAFKAPSPQLLYASPLVPGDIAGNRLLKPAYVHTLEGQLSYRPNRYVLLTTGVAYSYLLNQAEFVQRGLNQMAMNVSELESISWESELRLDYKRKVGAYANLAVNRTMRRSQEQGYVAELTSYRNAGYPTAIGNLGVSVAPTTVLPVRLSAELSYVSSRPSSTSNTIASGGRYELPAYVIVGGTIRWTGLELFSKKETALMLVARNLTNIRITDPGFGGIDYPQLGRTVMVIATQEW